MVTSPFDMEITKHLWTTPEVSEIFSENTRVQKWLDFESALARVQARLGLFPEEVGEKITAAARVENIDIPQVASEVRRIKHALVPVLKALQKNLPRESAELVHFGATTQDAIDTGLILQLHDAHKIYKRDIARLGVELKRLAVEHASTIMVGRTHGVHALPITFGHKCAIWLDEMARHAERLAECEKRVFVVMVVGAVGTQASYGPLARRIEEGVAMELDLGTPDISWGPARDRIAEYASLLALLSGTLGKIGSELFNLQRNEFAEVEEGFTDGKLGSSTMPHKRNPVLAENICMLSRYVRYNLPLVIEAMIQEHERDGIAWKSEWRAVPEMAIMVAAMFQQTISLVSGLQVNKDRMLSNTDTMKGYLLSENVMFALGEKVGKNTAHEWLYEASMRGIEKKLSFRDALHAHQGISGVFSSDQIQNLTLPQSYLGTIGDQIDRVVSKTAESGWMNPAAGKA